MSDPSNWPLSESASRVSLSSNLRIDAETKTITSECYPTAVGYYPKAKSHEMKRTEHDDFIMIYCVDGKGALSVYQSEFMIKAGDLFILPPHTEHYYKADDEQPWTVFWFHFKGLLAHQYLQHIYQKDESPIIRNITNIDFIQLFQELVDVSRNGLNLTSFVYSASICRHLLMKIAWIHNQNQRTETGLSIVQIQRYMKSRLNSNISLEELASISHCSKYHFAREYKRLTGVSPLQHFSEMKMEHACFLLEQTSLSMAEIASQLGYDDALYFSRVFRKSMGCSPSAFRKSIT